MLDVKNIIELCRKHDASIHICNNKPELNECINMPSKVCDNVLASLSKLSLHDLFQIQKEFEDRNGQNRDRPLWIEIDYAGWEQINFYEMKWRFVQQKEDPDHRDLKREDNGQWLITNDQGEFIIYSSEGEDGPDDSELIETYYQSWLKGKNSAE